MSENGDYKGKQTYSHYEGGKTMSVIKATLIFCFTLLVCVLIVVGFYHYQDRYVLVGTNEGLFVYDRKLHHLNHCNSEICKTLAIIKSPEELALLMPEVIQQQNAQHSGMICYPDPNKPNLPQQQVNPQLLLGHPSATLTPSQVISNQLQSAQQSLNASQLLQQQIPVTQPQQQISKPPVPAPTMMPATPAVKAVLAPQPQPQQPPQKTQTAPAPQAPQQKVPPFFPPQPVASAEPNNNTKAKKPVEDEEEEEEEEKDDNTAANEEGDEDEEEE